MGKRESSEVSAGREPRDVLKTGEGCRRTRGDGVCLKS